MDAAMVTSQREGGYKMPKQTEIERGFTLLARSDQWEQFVGRAVDAEIVDNLIGAGKVMYAIATLQALTNNRLVPKLVAHVICAREAYLNQCNTEVIEALFTKEVKE